MKTGFRFGTFLAAATFLAGVSHADCNLSLAVTPDSTVVAGDTVTIDVSGASPFAFAFLAFGTELGSTTMTVAGTSFDLGLNEPFSLLPLGPGDANVSATLTQVPDNLVGTTLYIQAFSLEPTMSGGSFSVDACVSNMDQLAF